MCRRRAAPRHRSPRPSRREHRHSPRGDLWHADQDHPPWTFIDCDTGEELLADSVKVNSNTVIEFNFAGLLPKTVAFVSVPYQDTQVQNSQGGFVRPGAQWFRSPI